jgi:DNA-binding MarR family transcriptional regulator
MAKSTPTASAGKASRPTITPLIGSLLRLPHEAMVARILESVQGQGFDLTPTELRVFLYPGPDGRRPAELARKCGMTRQAMNYVLASLQERGYIEREEGDSAAARVVRLTERGWQLIAQIRDCVARVEKEWAAHLGKERFEALRQALLDLSTLLRKLD